MNLPASRVVPVVVALVALAAFPLFGGKFAIDLVTKIMILAVFALSLELLLSLIHISEPTRPY